MNVRILAELRRMPPIARKQVRDAIRAAQNAGGAPQSLFALSSKVAELQAKNATLSAALVSAGAGA